MVIGHGRRREHPQPTLCTTTRKKILEKVTSLPVKHAQWSDPLDPPQIWFCPYPYTTYNCDLFCEFLFSSPFRFYVVL